MASAARTSTRLTTLYKRFNSVPTLTSARVSQGDHSLPNRSKYVVTSEWETLDVVRKERCNFAQTYVLSVSHEVDAVQWDFISEPSVTSVGRGFPLPDQNGTRILWAIDAHEPGLRALCLEYTLPSALSAAPQTTKTCAPEVGCFVQIWLHGTLLKTIKLPDSGDSACHGKVYSSSSVAFAGAAWSYDSKEIVYTAETVRKDGDSEHGVFRHEDDWGEGLDGVRRTVLCCLNVASGQVLCLIDSKKLPGVAPSKPLWCPKQRGIVFLGYAIRAYCLGVKYCIQRPCQLFHLDIASGQLYTLSDPTQSAHCPSFSPDGKCLVWLENPVGGPHSQCAALKALRWPMKEGTTAKTIVPFVDFPHSQSGFPGLYGELPERCWSSDGRYIVMSSIWGFHHMPLLIRIDLESSNAASESPSVIPLAAFDETSDMQQPCTIDVLDVYDDLVCARHHSITTPPVLATFSLRSFVQATEKRVEKPGWLFISPSGSSIGNNVRLQLSGVSQYPFDANLPEAVSFHSVNSMLICPKFCSQSQQLEVVDLLNDRSVELGLVEPLTPPDCVRGLIVWPHGGPHSAFTGSWSPLIAGFLASGFACLLLNFRGSLGYGNAALRSLLGHIGRNDVEDCVTATRLALNKLQQLLNNPVPAVLFGGSHGGFLVLHLAARYPSLYHAVVARNPVTNLTSMVDTSDIPDWCFTEAGLLHGHREWPLSHITDAGDFTQFSAMSPLNHLKQDWSAPLLLLLGAKDRRVPMSQGLTFYRKLKALCPTVPCEALILPHDSHPLESPTAIAVTFFNTLTWFMKHLDQSKST